MYYPAYLQAPGFHRSPYIVYLWGWKRFRFGDLFCLWFLLAFWISFGMRRMDDRLGLRRALSVEWATVLVTGFSELSNTGANCSKAEWWLLQSMSWERSPCSWKKQQRPQASNWSQQCPIQWAAPRMKSFGIYTRFYNSWAEILINKQPVCERAMPAQ